MNILDENIMESQAQVLRGWHIKVQRIGHEVGFLGMKDEEIIPLLHQLRFPTFFTRDLGFYERSLGHSNYCIVCLSVCQHEVASFIRRFLKHPTFDNNRKRIGKVVHISHIGIRIWHLHAEKEEKIAWNN
ncbi:hypothetical protein METP3_02555 [Methanosarcinales archaeon]|nr:hypothetical protein METP3_02555 [Methanosarcinales archaeon]